MPVSKNTHTYAVVVSDHTPRLWALAKTDETTPDQTTAEPVEDPGSVSLEQVQAQIVLWAPGSADANLVQNFAWQLQNYAQQNALSFRQRENLGPSQLSGTQTQQYVALASQAEPADGEQTGEVRFLYIVNLEESPAQTCMFWIKCKSLAGATKFFGRTGSSLGHASLR